MAGGEYWSAAVSIRRCSQLEQDPVLVALVTDGKLRPMTPARAFSASPTRFATTAPPVADRARISLVLCPVSDEITERATRLKRTP